MSGTWSTTHCSYGTTGTHASAYLIRLKSISCYLKCTESSYFYIKLPKVNSKVVKQRYPFWAVVLRNQPFVRHVRLEVAVRLQPNPQLLPFLSKSMYVNGLSPCTFSDNFRLGKLDYANAASIVLSASCSLVFTSNHPCSLSMKAHLRHNRLCGSSAFSLKRHKGFAIILVTSIMSDRLWQEI
jgi:hypothetical protein